MKTQEKAPTEFQHNAIPVIIFPATFYGSELIKDASHTSSTAVSHRLPALVSCVLPALFKAYMVALCNF